MDDCIFCKIVRKEIPAEIVYEDDSFISFLDVNPVAPGHLLIIPKEHYRWVWDSTSAGKYFEIVQKLALTLKQTFKTDLVTSKIIGDEVPHAHIHLIPDWNVPFDKADIKGNADRIRSNI